MNDQLKTLFDVQPTQLEYTELLKWARRIEKQALGTELPKLKIAVLGSSNTQFFTKILQVSLLVKEIQAEIYEGEYDSIRFEILNTNSELYAFKPEFLILLPSLRDLTVFPAILEPLEQVDQKIKDVVTYYQQLWETINQNNPCTILQANFVLPLENNLDQLEVNVPYSKTFFLNKLNQELMLNKPKQVHLIDENGLSNEIGKSIWFDPNNAFLNKAPYAYEWLPLSVDAYVRKIVALRGFYHKVLVLDLDNTLWGGVIGDDGVEGINLDPNHPIGEAYLAFQKYVLHLKDKGVMLAVCSKNEDAAAREGFKHPNMLIKLTDIACFIANWNDKASNLKTIAETLNVKTDTLVFFDDNPAEREIVKQFLKEATVIDVPEDPSRYVYALYQAHAFDWPQITREDLLRIKAVEEDTQREILKTQFVDYDAYLDSLHMVAQAGQIGSAQIERFVQLTNKSNQFNLRTQRYTESDIIHRMNDEQVACIYIDLYDRFSPYGIIACLVLKKSGSSAFIENWVMSCRVLNRGVETYALNLLIQQAKAWNCTELIGEYIPSSKNAMVKDHYTKMGFVQTQDNMYRLDLENTILHPTHIAVKEAK